MRRFPRLDPERKAFRQKLNDDAAEQRYGDYLWSQDREKFEVEFAKWRGIHYYTQEQLRAFQEHAKSLAKKHQKTVRALYKAEAVYHCASMLELKARIEATDAKFLPGPRAPRFPEWFPEDLKDDQPEQTLPAPPPPPVVPGQGSSADRLGQSMSWPNLSRGLDRLLREAGLEVKIGLRAQGKFDLVSEMLAAGSSWEEIGAAIGWSPSAAKEWYEEERL